MEPVSGCVENNPIVHLLLVILWGHVVIECISNVPTMFSKAFIYNLKLFAWNSCFIFLTQEVVGSIFSIGAVGSLCGVLIYQNLLKNHPFRDLLFWSQLLYGVSGLLDLILVLRINLRIGLPDYLFVVIDEAISRMIGRIKWMPLLVLSSKLCPAGIEGTFFALLMSIDHVGMLSSTWAGGLLLHVLKVTRTRFENLWMAILIRSILRMVPIGLLFLIPRSDPNLAILPAEMLKTKKGDDMLENGNLEMASLVDSSWMKEWKNGI